MTPEERARLRFICERSGPADRICLTGERDKWLSLLEEVERLEGENERLRKALEFYADEGCWYRPARPEACGAFSEAGVDRGAYARKVLEDGKE